VADHWLERWLPLLIARAGTQPVLEIGCGSGEDTATLVRAGLKVIALDRSATAVAKARARVPEARIECQDVRELFPSGAINLGAVVASLSLHYFAWLETLALVSRARDALHSGGLLLCRLNSTEDHNHGASGHPQIEPNFYMVNGEPKRFFDEKSVLELFATGWRRLSVEHFVTHKYAMPKALWEVVLERDT
jgi:SAM-dependent methyltransferase